VDFVRRWSEKTEIGAGRFIAWFGVTASKFYSWRERYGRVNEHNGWIPRDFWLEEWEKEAIIGFHLKNPLEGYGPAQRVTDDTSGSRDLSSACRYRPTFVPMWCLVFPAQLGSRPISSMLAHA
jgi:cellulase/cellobiase CelA1